MKTISFFLLVTLYSKNCFAYLDLNTANVILQAVLGGLAAILTTISIYWSKFKMFINHLKKKFFSKKINKKT